MTAPRVRAVVVNFNGGAMTLECIDALCRSEWPPGRLETVLVDNASHDGVAERAAARGPGVRVVRNARNLGFGGGCNAALGDLAAEAVDYVALVNNDAVVEPTWLPRLVAALESDPALGAAVGKVLFAPRFCAVGLETEPFVPGRGDRRRLGVRVSGVEVDGRSAWHDTRFPAGFFGLERGPDAEAEFRWSGPVGTVLVPSAPNGHAPDACRLRLASASEREVVLSCGGQLVRAVAGPEPRWIEVPLPGPWFDVINSAGGLLLDTGHGADRAFLALDDGRWDGTAEVFSWTGSAVVLRRSYLADVGLFDQRFFLYYEDLDLAWRGRLRGWRYAYVPQAVARHRHSATSGDTSPLLLHHLERNRLLTVTRNAPWAMVGRVLADFAALTLTASAREAANSVLVSRRLAVNVLRQRLGILGGYLRLAPGAVSDRARTRRRLVVSRGDVVRRWGVRRT